jgi:hypothetical protein
LGSYHFEDFMNTSNRVPSKYLCSNSCIRPESDYCGMPMPGTWGFLGLAGRPIELAVGLVTGATTITGAGDVVLSFLLYLP